MFNAARKRLFLKSFFLALLGGLMMHQTFAAALNGTILLTSLGADDTFPFCKQALGEDPNSSDASPDLQINWRVNSVSSDRYTIESANRRVQREVHEAIPALIAALGSGFESANLDLRKFKLPLVLQLEKSETFEVNTVERLLDGRVKIKVYVTTRSRVGTAEFDLIVLPSTIRNLYYRAGRGKGPNNANAHRRFSWMHSDIISIPVEKQIVAVPGVAHLVSMMNLSRCAHRILRRQDGTTLLASFPGRQTSLALVDSSILVADQASQPGVMTLHSEFPPRSESAFLSGNKKYIWMAPSDYSSSALFALDGSLTGQALRIFEKGQFSTEFDISADGTRLASGVNSGVNISDFQTGEFISTHAIRSVREIRALPQNDFVVVGTWDVHFLHDGLNQTTLSLPSSVMSAHLQEEGMRLVLFSGDVYSISYLDRRLQFIRKLNLGNEGNSLRQSDVTFSASGDRVAYGVQRPGRTELQTEIFVDHLGSSKGQPQVLSLPNPSVPRDFQFQQGQFSPDGNIFVAVIASHSSTISHEGIVAWDLSGESPAIIGVTAHAFRSVMGFGFINQDPKNLSLVVTEVGAEYPIHLGFVAGETWIQVE